MKQVMNAHNFIDFIMLGKMLLCVQLDVCPTRPFTLIYLLLLHKKHAGCVFRK